MPEHDPAHHRRRRVVQVHDHPLRALQRLRRCGAMSSSRAWVSTWIVTSSGTVLLDQQPHEVEVRLRRRREAHLDLLEADREPACRTSAACAPAPSARSAPGCRLEGRRCTTPALAPAPHRARCGRKAAPVGTSGISLRGSSASPSRVSKSKTARCLRWRAVDSITVVVVDQRARSTPRRNRETSGRWNDMIGGGVDGTRTRDPRRDRPVF